LRFAKLLLRHLPPFAIDGVEFPGFADIVEQTAGDDDVHVDGKLGIGGPHFPGDADRKPRDAT
jgi:hypothetical protein